MRGKEGRSPTVVSSSAELLVLTVNLRSKCCIAVSAYFGLARSLIRSRAVVLDMVATKCG